MRVLLRERSRLTSLGLLYQTPPLNTLLVDLTYACECTHIHFVIYVCPHIKI